MREEFLVFRKETNVDLKIGIIATSCRPLFFLNLLFTIAHGFKDTIKEQLGNSAYYKL